METGLSSLRICILCILHSIQAHWSEAAPPPIVGYIPPSTVSRSYSIVYCSLLSYGDWPQTASRGGRALIHPTVNTRALGAPSGPPPPPLVLGSERAVARYRVRGAVCVCVRERDTGAAQTRLRGDLVEHASGACPGTSPRT